MHIFQEQRKSWKIGAFTLRHAFPSSSILWHFQHCVGVIYRHQDGRLVLDMICWRAKAAPTEAESGLGVAALFASPFDGGGVLAAFEGGVLCNIIFLLENDQLAFNRIQEGELEVLLL